MGGLKFLETVRAESWTRTLPVIITSEQISQGLIKEVSEKKGDDLFTKDFSKGDLVTRLEYFVKRRHYQANQQAKSNILAVKIPFWKRSIDVISTGLALLLLSPILAIVSILIKLDSKGPIVYKSRRVGAGYKVFEIYKFRTMRTDADQLIKNMGSLNMYTKEINDKKIEGLCDDCVLKGACQQQLFLDGEVICEKAYLAEKKEKVAFMKFQNDPRITKFGGFLRNSSIDELPQLFNIFMGDMSLIGNRPLPLYEAEKLTTDKYIERFAGPGGLTGLWQVTKRGKGKKDMTEEERIELDIEYARNFSFKYDMKIFFMTFPALLQSENV
jgi:lipopolysaccharide/colanic/teichoic acid biosynthesis glycosyltransferase